MPFSNVRFKNVTLHGGFTSVAIFSAGIISVDVSRVSRYEYLSKFNF